MHENIIIRPAEESDAASMLEHLKVISNEWPNNLFMSPEDPVMTEEQERAFIRSFSGSRNLLLVALDRDRVIGSLTMGVMDKKKTRHAANLGIALQPDYRGEGIGRRMMEWAIAFARKQGLHRIGLSVYTRNVAAIRLYESLGFEHEGTKRHSMFEDGEYFDEYQMGLIFP